MWNLIDQKQGDMFSPYNRLLGYISCIILDTELISDGEQNT